jgi:hypothetical protein
LTPEEKKEFFLKEVARIINICSMENISNTPDFLLAADLWAHFVMINDLINKRSSWYGLNTRKIGDINAKSSG